jgi:predicted DNA-binding transcriptional regulator AlpA
MLATTIKIVRSGLESDPTLTSADRAKLMAVLRNGAMPRTKPETPPPDNPPRLLRRAEVASRLSCSLRTVDKLAIKKVKLPGRQRAAGFLESDINALLAGKDEV